MHSINVKHKMQHSQHSINHSKQLSIPDLGNAYNIAQLTPIWNKEISIPLQFLWPTWIRKAQAYCFCFFHKKGLLINILEEIM